VVDIWNQRVREAGFVTEYSTMRVRGRANDDRYGHLPRVPREALPPELQTLHRQNWFRKADAYNVYLKPEANKYIVASPEATGICPRCDRPFGMARNREWRGPKKDLPFTPWYWCARCRTAHVPEWKQYYHEHGPNKHLPFREDFPYNLYGRKEQHNG
jgi:hypothetical protein